MLKFLEDYRFPSGTTAYGHKAGDKNRRMELFTLSKGRWMGLDEETGYNVFRIFIGKPRTAYDLYVEQEECVHLLGKRTAHAS